MPKVKQKSKSHLVDVAHLFEYQVNISFDSRDQLFVARVPELDHCHTHGHSAEEALANAKEAIELWIETAKEKHITIPEPTSRRRFSGKFVVRTPESVHAHLAQEALRQGKSMNDLAVELISIGLQRH